MLPLNESLNFRKAKHLLRRASYILNKDAINTLVGLSIQDALNLLSIEESNTWSEPYDPLPLDSPDGYWLSSTELPTSFSGQTRKRRIITSWWWYNGLYKTTLKHKLTFFLHTSFTVSKDGGSVTSSHFYDHLRLLDFYAYGNIKTLAKKITFDNSMLHYLNNTTNNSNNPNENYAREFLELFTILKGPQIADGDYTNYTELDIQEAAKVFS